ncbi:unnamed protein product, partial [Meganyctiphanes norvegica]
SESIDLGLTNIFNAGKSRGTQKEDSSRISLLPIPSKIKLGKFKKPAVLPKPMHIGEKKKNKNHSHFLFQNEKKNSLQMRNEDLNAHGCRTNSPDLSQNEIQCYEEEHVYNDCSCGRCNNCAKANHLDVLNNMEVKHSYIYGENDIQSNNMQNHLNIIVSEFKEGRQRSLSAHTKTEGSTNSEVDISNQRRNLQVFNIRPRASSYSPPRRSQVARKPLSSHCFRINQNKDTTMLGQHTCTFQCENGTFDPNTTHICCCRSSLPALANSCPSSPWMARTAAGGQHFLDDIGIREAILPPSPTPSSKSIRKRMSSGRDLMRKMYTNMKEKKNTPVNVT